MTLRLEIPLHTNHFIANTVATVIRWLGSSRALRSMPTASFVRIHSWGASRVLHSMPGTV